MGRDGKTLAGMVGSYDNLDEPIPLSNKPETILGVCITLQIVAWSCTLLRLWTRIRVIKAPGWDDFFVLMAQLSTAVGSIMICIGGTHYGLGKHFIEIGGHDAMSDYLKGFYVANGAYILSTTFIKLALLLQYMRIFQRGSLSYRFCLGMTIFVSLWGLAYTIIGWFPCSPISEYWSLNPDAHCWGFASQDPMTFQVTFETHSSLNTILDLIVLAIPAALYFRSSVDKKTRWGLSGILLLGLLANFASIWRLVTIVKHEAATQPTFDPTWYGCVSIILSAVEVDLAVVCASVPVFWPVIQSTGFQIFITQEVEVKTENRLGSSDHAEDGDGIELQGAGALPAGATEEKEHNSRRRSGSVQSDAGSETTLRNTSSENSTSSGAKTADYYNDKFVQDHVGPPRKPKGTQPGMEVSVSANDGQVTNTTKHDAGDDVDPFNI